MVCMNLELPLPRALPAAMALQVRIRLLTGKDRAPERRLPISFSAALCYDWLGICAGSSDDLLLR